MRSTKRRHAAALLLLPVAATLTLAGCGGDSGYETGPEPTEPTMSQPTVDSLCSILDSQQGTWKALGPEVGRVAFNGVMRLWALRDTTANAAISYDRYVVDDVTGRSCPEVRTDTLAVLDYPDMKTALNGF
ncbi:hypothetical protein [Nocardia caishijiensis]|uniref:LppP/LprE lipoprotein n=1 Tax=Nocardia caishijiensis TaxID=184756 RepID=A0ABQ6YNH1_9NOCA|nr:hypothetical protein [Nocardia caishijiensis]KAF0847335.1 hypothetical protein FNL39_103233 [Nocardia caishijiensis]